MTRPARLAVIGAGLIGARHLTLARDEPDCEIVAGVDPDPAARGAVEAVGARFYAAVEPMLDAETLDGVIVATPNSAHAPVGIQCLERGLAVLMEKPFADTVRAGEALLEAAQRSGAPLAVGHHRRFDPTVERAGSLIAAGEIGQLTGLHFLWSMRKQDAYYDVRWRTERPGGGPILINLIHDIDLMRCFGGPVSRVYAETGNDARGHAVEDIVAATLRFTSGAVGSIVASDAAPSPWGWELGSGENPLIPATLQNCYQLLGTAGSIALPRLELWRHADRATGNWHQFIGIERAAFQPRAALVAQLAHFCKVARREEVPRVSGAEGLATLAVTAAITVSGDTGLPVSL
ncbi:MAG: Gfo/Idh/MocA family oxidoreductase [Pseudomonadota bacterium]